jgi:hypothetical protein
MSKRKEPSPTGEPKKLKLIGLVLLIFYGVSGGPFGMELIVQAGGPFYALVGFSLLLVWAVPEGMFWCFFPPRNVKLLLIH